MGGIVPGVNNLLDPALLAELDRIAKTLPLNASAQQIGQAFVQGLSSQPAAAPGVAPTASGLGNWGSGVFKGTPAPAAGGAPAPATPPAGIGQSFAVRPPVPPHGGVAATGTATQVASAPAAAAPTASAAGEAASASRIPEWMRIAGRGIGKTPGVTPVVKGAAKVLSSPLAQRAGVVAQGAAAIHDVSGAAQGNLGRELSWSEKIAQRLGLDTAVNKLFGIENSADEQMRQQNQQAALRQQLSGMGYPAVKEPTMQRPAPPAPKPPAPAPAPQADTAPAPAPTPAPEAPPTPAPAPPTAADTPSPIPDRPTPQLSQVAPAAAEAPKKAGWGEALQALGRMNPFTALAPSGMDASFYQAVMRENMLQQERHDQVLREQLRIQENEKNRQAELQAMDSRFREEWERWKAEKAFTEAENAKNRAHQKDIYEDRDKTYPASPEVAAKLGVPVGTPVPISALTGVAQITASEGYRSEQRSLTERGQNIDSAQGLRQEAARLRAGLQGAEGLLLQKQNPQAYQDMLARIAQYEQRADALDVQVPGAVQPGAAPGPSAEQTTAPPPPQPAQPQGGMFSGGLSALGGALAGPNNYPGAVQPQKPTAAQVEATMPQEIRSGITKLGSAEQNAISLAYEKAGGNMADLAQSLLKITQKYPGTANLLNPEINRLRR